MVAPPFFFFNLSVADFLAVMVFFVAHSGIGKVHKKELYGTKMIVKNAQKQGKIKEGKDG